MTEGDELEFWTRALKLPEFRVVHVRRDTSSDPLVLTVVPTMPLGLCSGCCRATDCLHRTLDSGPIKDLSVGPQTVELIVLNAAGQQWIRVEIPKASMRVRGSTGELKRAIKHNAFAPGTCKETGGLSESFCALCIPSSAHLLHRGDRVFFLFKSTTYLQQLSTTRWASLRWLRHR